MVVVAIGGYDFGLGFTMVASGRLSGFWFMVVDGLWWVGMVCGGGG